MDNVPKVAGNDMSRDPSTAVTERRGRRALLQVALGLVAAVTGGRAVRTSRASAADNDAIKQGAANDANNTATSTTTLQADLAVSPVLVVKNTNAASGTAQAIVADASAGGLPLLVKGSSGVTGAGIGVNGVDEGLGLQVFGITSGTGMSTGAETGVGLDSFATTGTAIRAAATGAGIALDATAGTGTAIRARSATGKALDVRGDSTFAGKAAFKRGVTARRFTGPGPGGVPGFASVGRSAVAPGKDRVEVAFAGVSARSAVLAVLRSSPGSGIVISHVESGAGKFTVVLSGPAAQRTALDYFVLSRV